MAVVGPGELMVGRAWAVLFDGAGDGAGGGNMYYSHAVVQTLTRSVGIIHVAAMGDTTAWE